MNTFTHCLLYILSNINIFHFNVNFFETGDETDDEFENSQAATRSKSRFEIKLPLKPPFTDNGFVDNRWLVYILKLIMSERILVDTFSFVTSLGNAPDQHWHNDVSGLFTNGECLSEGAAREWSTVVIVILVFIS